MAVTTTSVLADFVASLTFASLPVELIQRIKRQGIDTVGVALAGVSEDAARLVRQIVATVSGQGASSVWGTDWCATAADAALANATAAHALDFDDMWLPGSHPSSPTFPAAIALAEARHCSGAELIAAQAAGYEVMGRVHSAVTGRAGWHPTGVFGTFGAVAAASRLLGLSPRQTEMAFGISSSMAGGIEGHSGTMTKALHAGLAAQSGVRAALLAEQGFTAATSAFEGKHSFFASFFGTVTPQTWRLTANLGRDWHLLNPGIGIKVYPAGYYMHQTFEAALAIVEEHDLAPEDVVDVRIGVTHRRFDRQSPGSGLDAKFSLQYMAVAAILFRRLTVDLFDPSLMERDDVRSLLARTELRPDGGLTDNLDLANNPVTIRCTGGREYTETVVIPRSHWRADLPRDTWIGKFLQNAEPLLGSQQAERLVGAFEDLEALEDVGELTSLLRPASPDQ